MEMPVPSRLGVTRYNPSFFCTCPSSTYFLDFGPWGLFAPFLSCCGFGAMPGGSFSLLSRRSKKHNSIALSTRTLFDLRNGQSSGRSRSHDQNSSLRQWPKGENSFADLESSIVACRHETSELTFAFAFDQTCFATASNSCRSLPWHCSCERLPPPGVPCMRKAPFKCGVPAVPK